VVAQNALVEVWWLTATEAMTAPAPTTAPMNSANTKGQLIRDTIPRQLMTALPTKPHQTSICSNHLEDNPRSRSTSTFVLRSALLCPTHLACRRGQLAQCRRLRDIALGDLALIPDHMVLLCPILVYGAVPHGFECALFADRAHVDVEQDEGDQKQRDHGVG